MMMMNITNRPVRQKSCRTGNIAAAVGRNRVERLFFDVATTLTCVANNQRRVQSNNYNYLWRVMDEWAAVAECEMASFVVD